MAQGVWLALVFAAGLAVGGWVFASPWVVGYPAAPRGGWSAAVWTCVLVGGAVAAASGVAAVVVLGGALHAALAGRE